MALDKAILSMVKELKEITSEELKKCFIVMSHETDNINKEMELLKTPK
jgi:hypothetical protein